LASPWRWLFINDLKHPFTFWSIRHDLNSDLLAEDPPPLLSLNTTLAGARHLARMKQPFDMVVTFIETDGDENRRTVILRTYYNCRYAVKKEDLPRAKPETVEREIEWKCLLSYERYEDGAEEKEHVQDDKAI